MTVKISRLLTEYFDQRDFEKSEIFPSYRREEVIKPKKMTWEIHTNPERFSKRFLFDTRDRMISFVNEVMSYEDEVRHHGEIRVNHTEVDISVYTHDVNRITELDKEYIRSVDNIHRDVLDFEYR